MAAPKDEQAPKAEAQQDILREQQAKPAGSQAQQSQAQQADRDESSVRDDVTVKTAQDPFPAYDQLPLEQLRSLAQEKSVGVPADVEKAALIAKLRRVGPGPTDSSGVAGPHDVAEQGEATGGGVEVKSPDSPYPSYDLMTVEELRGLLPDGESALTEEEERGYLVGQLRAVASGPTAAQSAQVGSNRPGNSLDVPSGVSDKDLGRG